MSNTRDIFRRLINDDTVKEKKPWDGTVDAPKPKPPAPATQQARPTRVEPIHRPPPPRVRETPPPVEVLSGDKLDPDCEHQWKWQKGVKTCWLCGGPAPLDRRDSTTRWKK